MDADRAQSPAAGSAEAGTPHPSGPGEVGPVWVEITGAGTWRGGLDLLDRLDDIWIPIDPPPGRSLPASSPDRRPDLRADHRRARRRLTVVYAVVVALLVSGTIVAIGAHGRLHTTDDQLTAVRIRLHQTIGRAQRADRSLAAVTAQSAAAATTLATETSQLAAAQAQLASAEVNVFTNGVSINQLDTCLAGVERALNQISLNDQQGAATSLDGVAAACRAAEPSP